MKLSLGLAAVLWLAEAQPAHAAPPPSPPKSSKTSERTEPELVEVLSVIPDALLDLRYTTEQNFLGRRLYPEGARCLLLRETATKLEAAATALRARGFRLKLFDCYRPRSVQWEMWKVLPKPGYVANPRFGSNHNRGAAVDLTLTTLDGKAVEMPTDFDVFGPQASHRYPGGSPAARANRALLLEAMTAAGFKPNRAEWWHYDLPDARSRPVLDRDMTKVP